MKKANFLITLILIFFMLVPASAVSAADNGVNDLRGRWDVEWFFSDAGESFPPLILYVNDIRATSLPSNYLASGCMRSPDTNVLMPLSLRAIFNNENNSYDLTVFSTIVPSGEFGEPFLIRFNGTVSVNGNGVKDDEVSGNLMSEFSTGEWSGLHHDRRRTKCPSVLDSGLSFQGDVYAHTDLSSINPSSRALIEGYTVIVSSGMRVEASDGSSFVVQEYTDIFSPDIDFVGRFRYLENFDGLPDSGEIYHFTLLDIFGDPIPGTESSDVWYGCNQGAPLNLTADPSPYNPILLSWDPVEYTPGEFEPSSEIGFYQMGVFPAEWESDSNFGASGIAADSHFIPWDTFEPGSPGFPDGQDFGVSLSEFQDGSYWINVGAFGVADPQYGGIGLECAVFNSEHDLLLTKAGDDLTFQNFGNITGFVFDADGNPLGGIGVDIEEGGYGTCTNEYGFYHLQNIPNGVYNVAAGRDFCEPHPFEEQIKEDIPVGAEGVDFRLIEEPVLPTIIAQSDHEWVSSSGWTVGEEITMSVYDNIYLSGDPLLVLVQTATSADGASPIGQVWFDKWAPFDLTPGMVVTLTNGSITETLLVEEFSVDAYDETANTVSGSAPAGREVGVGVHQPDEDYWLVVTSDASGHWFADFGAEDVNMIEVLDIHAMLWDEDGDATQANYPFLPAP